MVEENDLYDLLGVPPTATAKQIAKAYRAKIQACHPDRHGGSARAQELTKQLLEAYQILKDPAARQRYDSLRRARRLVARTRAESATRAHLQPRVPAVRSTSVPSRRPVRSSAIAKVAEPPGRGGGFWAAIAGIGVVGAAVLLAKANSWDADVGRYRSRRGQFRKGRFS